MPKTFILIRCVEFNQRIEEMIALFQASLPSWTVVAVPDCTGLDEERTAQRLAEFSVPALGITDTFITESGLHHAHSGARTGWLCGDYVFYRALELQWDYAWLVEPDLYFLNGAEDILRRLQKLEHDLIATHLWPSGPQWMWGEALLNSVPDIKPYAMAFPFCRLSRELVKESLSLRKKIADGYPGTGRLPNDEVVVASTAYDCGFSMLDVQSLYEEAFRFWGTITRVSIEDVQDSFDIPLIVHSGQKRDRLDPYLDRYLKGALEGSELYQSQLLKSLRTASKETILQFVSRALETYGSKK